MPETQVLVITSIHPLVNLDTLIGTQVQAMPMDDPVFKYDKYVGVIDAVKIHKFGLYVHFKTPELVGAKWIRLEKVVGYAHYEAPAVEAKPAHETDKGRQTGQVSYVNAKAGYGYIYSEGGSYRFDTRNILGSATLSKGAAVTFAMGFSLSAANIVATGNAVSEAVYTQWMEKKAAAKTALPRARRRDIATQQKTAS